MNIQLQGSNLFTGNTFLQNRGLKSTKEKQQRQAERDNQVDFLENQKSNLKNMKCDSLEEISRKLDMIHSYEDQIAAVKEEYNNSQMLHVMDEAKERGEQIAKAAEKYAPKTSEERREELVEEALGTDENKGELTENMEELSELAEEMIEEMTELPENISSENMTEQLSEELTADVSDSAPENISVSSDMEKLEELKRNYRGMDIRI